MNTNLEIIKSIAKLAPNFKNNYHYVKIQFDDKNNIIGFKFTNELDKREVKNFIYVKNDMFITKEANELLEEINKLIG